MSPARFQISSRELWQGNGTSFADSLELNQVQPSLPALITGHKTLISPKFGSQLHLLQSRFDSNSPKKLLQADATLVPRLFAGHRISKL